jgi:hypothetical protein
MQPPLPADIWDRTPPEAQAYILQLAARVATLEATVQALTERLSQDSSTSSRPPSSDSPERKRPRRRRQPSGRRPGGQPGHRGQTRTLLPVEEGCTMVLLRHPCAGTEAEQGRTTYMIERIWQHQSGEGADTEISPAVEETLALEWAPRCSDCGHSELFHYKDGYKFCQLCELKERMTLC